MEDRELLELAAKAAGYIEVWNPDGWTDDGPWRWHEEMKWNPLTDDGNALQLAVKLELEIRVFNGKAHAGKQDKFWRTETWFPDGDVNAATRRAIVRAAAELGKQMP